MVIERELTSMDPVGAYELGYVMVKRAGIQEGMRAENARVIALMKTIQGQPSGYCFDDRLQKRGEK